MDREDVKVVEEEKSKKAIDLGSVSDFEEKTEAHTGRHLKMKS